MMWSRRVLGVDVGSSWIKVVQVILSPGGKRVLAKTALLEDRSEFVALLSDRDWRKPAEPVHASFPSDRVVVRPLSLPFKDPAKIRQALPFELEGEVPFGAEEMLAGYLPAQGLSVLALAAPKEAVAARLKELRDLGLDPPVLEPEIAALARLLPRAAPGAPATFAVLEAGASKTNLLVFQEGSLRAVRSIPKGLGEDEKGIPQELILEIGRTFRALQARGETSWPQGLYVCGGLSERESFLEQMTEHFGIQVQHLNPLEGWISHASNPAEVHSARFCTALGLALHGLDRATAGSNLRFGEFAYRPGIAAMRGKMVAAGVLMLMAAGLGMADLQAQVVVRQRQLEALQKETRGLFRQAFPEVTQIVDPVLQMQRLLEERKRRHLTLLTQDPRTTALELLREISVREQARTLRITELDITGESVNIRGEASAYDVIEKAKDHWSASPLLEGVEIKNAKKNPKSQLWDFQCSARRKAS